MDDTSKLKTLGSSTKYAYDNPDASILETFPNKNPDAAYLVELTFSEFTSLCPKTGQPDFASIVIQYVPQALCVESKSLKLYLFAYRGYGAFMETTVNKILDDLLVTVQPRFMRVTGVFNARGGIGITVRAESPDSAVLANAIGAQ